MKTSPTESLPFLELELMHHFSTIVYRTLSDDIVVQELWRHDVPKEALQHAHLMHAILALSALHLQHSHKDAQQAAKYQEPAIQHHKLALSQLQLLVVQVDQASCGSVLSTATLLGFFSSANMRFGEEDSKFSEDFWHNHQLLRGVHTVIKHAESYINEIMLSAIMNPKPWDHVQLPPYFQQAMDRLHANISASGIKDETKREIYLGALQRLQENVKADIANPENITISYMLLLAADGRFMFLVGEKEPLAVSIAAHYALILHRQQHRWWMGDNGKRYLRIIKGWIAAGSEDLIEWPDRFLLEHTVTQDLGVLSYYSG